MINLQQPKTMICLVSNQRMQNIIPLFQKNLIIKKVILVASKDSQNPAQINPFFKKIALEYMQALTGTVVWEIAEDYPIDAVDIEDGQKMLNRLIRAQNQSETLLINYTGGTKPMSIAAYNAAMQHHLPALYVDTQIEKIHINHQGNLYSYDFDLSPISPEQILNIHGKTINQSETQKRLPSENAKNLTKILINFAPESIKALDMIRKELLTHKNSKNERFISEQTKRACNWLLDPMESMNWLYKIPNNQFAFSKPALKFLNGDWLELFTAQLLEKSGKFSDVQTNVVLLDFVNELDVVCSYNGKLAIIECKSGNIFNDKESNQVILNRLRALKESLAGVFGKTYLVTSKDVNKESPVFHNRAGEYVNKVFDLHDLPLLTSKIENDMSAKRRV